MAKKVALGIAGALIAIVLLFILVVAMRPSEYRITRAAKMAASPAVVFEQVNDFHNWDAWSPWAKLDPNAKMTFVGPSSGKGAGYSWSGNDKVGEGHQTITESRESELIRIKLDFEKPMKDTCTVEFNFKPAGDQTEMTWSMFGKQNFVGKAFCMFMDMDKMVGGDFEKGLASLKALVEAKPAASQENSNPAPQPTPDTQSTKTE